ncbi:MAG TPA: hypothetical protein VHA12_00845 [Candidatus Nanoarchaeia archaeon]|nr:hypothetical protein [Candidatus Nanoarchaeia archaeon]
MEKEIIDFISQNNLSYINSRKTTIKAQASIFKTTDAKAVATNLIQHISKNFFFADTSNIFNFFPFIGDEKEIKKRQDFFTSQRNKTNIFLKEIKIPRPNWKVPYAITSATEDETTFLEMKKQGIPCRLIISESDLSSLEQFDLVYVIDCEQYSRALEMLASSVFVNNIDEIYLERHLSELSGWKENITLLKNQNDLPEKVKLIVNELDKTLLLLEQGSFEEIDEKRIEHALREINLHVQEKLKTFTFGGEELMMMMQKGILPPAINSLITSEIISTKLPQILFKKSIPVQLDEEEVEKLLRKQSADKFTAFAKKILKEKNTLRNIPKLLKELSNYLIYLDFVGGIGREIANNNDRIEISTELVIEESKNKLIDRAEPISFHLSEKFPCSILTGANSGGKTTLLEHIIQIIVQSNLGLPSEGRIKTPIFSEVYYFAKNKGSASKGAFETLLTQLATIKPGKQTIILADEVEAVTEPGVAGRIMQATIEYFVPRGCYMVIATHLGQELQKQQPANTRIDGIEAIGLNEKFELIVNHNPVLGKLARSTPELIVERMSKTNKNEYFDHLYKQIKNDKK